MYICSNQFWCKKVIILHVTVLLIIIRDDGCFLCSVFFVVVEVFGLWIFLRVLLFCAFFGCFCCVEFFCLFVFVSRKKTTTYKNCFLSMVQMPLMKTSYEMKTKTLLWCPPVQALPVPSSLFFISGSLSIPVTCQWLQRFIIKVSWLLSHETLLMAL